MEQPGTREQAHVHEVRIEGACPACEGALVARITPGGVWTWCRACRRLGRSAVAAGPQGPVFLHSAAMA